jgi:hypothetical protein
MPVRTESPTTVYGPSSESSDEDSRGGAGLAVRTSSLDSLLGVRTSSLDSILGDDVDDFIAMMITPKAKPKCRSPFVSLDETDGGLSALLSPASLVRQSSLERMMQSSIGDVIIPDDEFSACAWPDTPPANVPNARAALEAEKKRMEKYDLERQSLQRQHPKPKQMPHCNQQRQYKRETEGGNKPQQLQELDGFSFDASSGLLESLQELESYPSFNGGFDSTSSMDQALRRVDQDMTCSSSTAKAPPPCPRLHPLYKCDLAAEVLGQRRPLSKPIFRSDGLVVCGTEQHSELDAAMPPHLVVAFVDPPSEDEDEDEDEDESQDGSCKQLVPSWAQAQHLPAGCEGGLRDCHWLTPGTAVLGVGSQLALLHIPADLREHEAGIPQPKEPTASSPTASSPTASSSPSACSVELLGGIVHSDCIRELALHPFEPHQLASAGFDRTLVVTNVDHLGGSWSAPVVRRFLTPGVVGSLSWSPFEHSLLSCTIDTGRVQVFDMRCSEGRASMPVLDMDFGKQAQYSRGLFAHAYHAHAPEVFVLGFGDGTVELADSRRPAGTASTLHKRRELDGLGMTSSIPPPSWTSAPQVAAGIQYGAGPSRCSSSSSSSSSSRSSWSERLSAVGEIRHGLLPGEYAIFGVGGFVCCSIEPYLPHTPSIATEYAPPSCSPSAMHCPPSPPFAEFPERRCSRFSSSRSPPPSVADGDSSFASNSIDIKTAKEEYNWTTVEPHLRSFEAFTAWGCHEGYNAHSEKEAAEEGKGDSGPWREQDEDEEQDDEDYDGTGVRCDPLEAECRRAKPIGKGTRAMEMLRSMHHGMHHGAQGGVTSTGSRSRPSQPPTSQEYYKTSGDFLPWRKQLGVTDSQGILAFYDAHPIKGNKAGAGGGEPDEHALDMDIAHV